MLVSGGQGSMRIEVTYGVSRLAHVVRFCCVRCCSFLAANRQVVPLFLAAIRQVVSLFVVFAIMTARQTNNSLAAALSSFEVPSASVSSAAASGTPSFVSSQPGEPVVVSSPLVSSVASATPLPPASTAVLSPDLVALINQAVQAA